MSMQQTLEQNKTFIRNHFEEVVNRKNSAIAGCVAKTGGMVR